MKDLKISASPMASLAPSATLAISAKAKALKAAGENVCPMGAGEPDFDTPAHIKQAAVDALMRGETKYTPASGIPELKAAIADKFKKDNGIETDPSRIIVSPGAKFSVFAAVCSLCGPGDEVILPAPYWLSYPEMIKAAGATMVPVHTVPADSHGDCRSFAGAECIYLKSNGYVGEPIRTKALPHHINSGLVPHGIRELQLQRESKINGLVCTFAVIVRIAGQISPAFTFHLLLRCVLLRISVCSNHQSEYV